jgi:diguanylate cyclase (GGDEF)-like protein
VRRPRLAAPRRSSHGRAAGRPARLVARFALLSALALTLAGGGIIWYVHDDATSRAQREVARDALLVSATVLREGDLIATDFAAPVDARRRELLDALFQRRVLGTVAESVSLYGPDGTLTYTSGGSSRRPTAEEVRRALSGERVLGVGRLRTGPGADGAKEVMNVLAPIQFHRGGPASGVLQLEQDYRPTAREIAAGVRRIALALGAALVAIYAALFPILSSASRRLRTQAAENARLALHDGLTGLPNRTLFRDRVTQALLSARRGGPPPAVMLMDLDRFKEINDTLGHQAGDRVLEEVARRLSAALRESDTIARLGGDEFAILLGGVASHRAAERVARVVRAALEDPIVVQDMALSVEASCGIALWPEHGDDVDALVRCADVAMYRAKGSRSGFAVYAPGGEDEARDRLALAGELRHAVGAGQIEVLYQPKVCLRTGRVAGVEALARWRHPRLGVLGPEAFIGLAEQSGLIHSLTLDVLRQSLRQSRAWRDDGFRVPVAVNLSAHHLLDRDLPGDVARALAEAGLDAGMLELEITESAVIANPRRAREVVGRLRDMGVRLAIDDFGVGHSSLGQLAELPVHVLKIDRSFVSGMGPETPAELIVRSTVELGRSLGLELVAEGVETTEAWDALRALGCDLAQGYHVSRPLSADDVVGVLLERGIRPAPATRSRGARRRSRLRPAAETRAEPALEEGVRVR